MTTIKIKVNDDDEVAIEWRKDTATREEIGTIAYAVRRKLLEAFGLPTLENAEG